MSGGATPSEIRGFFDEAERLAAKAREVREAYAAIAERAKKKNIDWAQLKALAAAHDADKNPPEGKTSNKVNKLVAKHQFACWYAEILDIGQDEQARAIRSSSVTPFKPAPVTPQSHTDDRQRGADAESQDESPSPVGASATNSVSLEAAASEGSVRSPNQSRGGVEGHAEAPGLPVANEYRGAKACSGTLARSLDRGGENPKGGAVSPDTRQPAAGVEPGPRDTKQIGEGAKANSTLLSPPSGGTDGEPGKSAAALDSINAASMAFPGGDLEAAPIAVSLSSDPLTVPAELRREPNNGVWQS